MKHTTKIAASSETAKRKMLKVVKTFEKPITARPQFPAQQTPCSSE